MITLKNKVHAALDGLCGDVIYGTPADFSARERVVWRESLNRRHAQADGREYLAELNYTLDFFARSAEAAATLFAAADERMTGAGFRRESAAEIYDGEGARISARYRSLCDEKGNMCQ